MALGSRGPRAFPLLRGMLSGPAQLAVALVGTQNPSLSISSQAEGTLENPASIAPCELGLCFRPSPMLGPTRSSGLLIRLPVANLPGLCFLQGKRVDYFKLMFGVIGRAPSHSRRLQPAPRSLRDLKPHQGDGPLFRASASARRLIPTLCNLLQLPAVRMKLSGTFILNFSSFMIPNFRSLSSKETGRRHLAAPDLHPPPPRCSSPPLLAQVYPKEKVNSATSTSPWDLPHSSREREGDNTRFLHVFRRTDPFVPT